MNIVVILRSVPDTNDELPLVDGVLDWDEASLKLNEFDDYALEEAVLIKEETDAKVIALGLASLGDRALQTAIARGADAAVKIEAKVEDGASARALAGVFAEAISHLQADLVLTGVQTTDDSFGPLVPFLAAKLGWPQLNGATAVRATVGGVGVQQDYGGGRSARLAIAGPAVIGVQSARQPPRYVSGSKLRQVVQTARIERLTSSVGQEAEPATLVSLGLPPKTSVMTMLASDPDEAVDQIIALLGERGLGATKHA